MIFEKLTNSEMRLTDEVAASRFAAGCKDFTAIVDRFVVDVKPYGLPEGVNLVDLIMKGRDVIVEALKSECTAKYDGLFADVFIERKTAALTETFWDVVAAARESISRLTFDKPFGTEMIVRTSADVEVSKGKYSVSKARAEEVRSSFVYTFNPAQVEAITILEPLLPKFRELRESGVDVPQIVSLFANEWHFGYRSFEDLPMVVKDTQKLSKAEMAARRERESAARLAMQAEPETISIDLNPGRYGSDINPTYTTI